MKRLQFTGFFLLLGLAFGCSKKSDLPVVEDNNGIKVVSGKVQGAAKGLAGVVVTDGTGFVVTDVNGSYTLTCSPTAKHIYISTPSGYYPPVINSVPRFFISLGNIPDKKNVNFNLLKSVSQDEKHFFVAIGDPQVSTQADITKYEENLRYLKSDILQNQLNPVHMMVCGDIVYDKPVMHDQVKSSHAFVDQPFYCTIGNHDCVADMTLAASDANNSKAADVYTGHYGPTCYSFNRGQAHYLILNNIFYRGGPNTEFLPNITAEQLEWAKKDLSYVGREKVLIVMVHHPVKSRSGSIYGNNDQLLALCSGYKEVHVLVGHKHYNSVVTDNSGITEHIVGAACGAWWAGPVCPDGAGLGYKIFEIDGTSVKWKYRAYQSPGKQFVVYKPGPRSAGLRPREEMIVNVWDWDPSWSVKWSEDNGTTFREMARFTDMTYDPAAFDNYGTVSSMGASLTEHIFTCIPAPNTRKVIIRVVNRFSETFTETVSW